MFRNIHHISYTVSDLDRSIPFYRDVLGFEFLHEVDRENIPSYDQILGYNDVKLRIAAFSLPNSDVTLELMQFRHPKAALREQDFLYVATSHVAYQVDDIQAEFRRIKQAGGHFVSPVAKIRREGKYIGMAVFLLDPDHILIEPIQLA